MTLLKTILKWEKKKKITQQFRISHNFKWKWEGKCVCFYLCVWFCLSWLVKIPEIWCVNFIINNKEKKILITNIWLKTFDFQLR